MIFVDDVTMLTLNVVAELLSLAYASNTPVKANF